MVLCCMKYLLLCCILLPITTFGYYCPNVGRWTTRDPIEEKGGANLYAFCKNDPIGKVDPLGQDVYLMNAGEEGDLSVAFLHQKVAVDEWSKARPYRKIGKRAFSFGYTGHWRWFDAKGNWLGWSSICLPGYYMVGRIYEDDTFGTIVKQKKMTCKEDMSWLKKMARRAAKAEEDVYSLLRHNCRKFSQQIFADAP